MFFGLSVPLFCTCMHACVRACMHACVRACVYACVRACVRVCMPTQRAHSPTSLLLTSSLLLDVVRASSDYLNVIILSSSFTVLF